MWQVKKPDGSWRVTMDYWELSKVVSPIHATVPQIATILDTLATVLGVFHAMQDLANAFFQSLPGHWVTRSICLHVGGATVGFSGTSPRLPAPLSICHRMGASEHSLFSFPTSLKWAHYIDNMLIILSCKDLPVLQGHSADFTGTSVRETTM